MVLVVTHETGLDHRPGPGHPEAPERLRAVADGVELAASAVDVVAVSAQPAPVLAIASVHDERLLEQLARVDEAGGGPIDPDTTMSAGSLAAARHAAGAGLTAVAALRSGEHDAAFVAVRPPGHHATPHRSMGFCLLNNVAVTARALTAAGERVAIVDWDVHHGNGTQDVFWDDPDVLFVSIHQGGIYPGTGHLSETGGPAAEDATVNVPLPAGATGAAAVRAVDRVVAPLLESFAPDWLLVSAGFDGHRADPLAGLAYETGDFADLTWRLVQSGPGPGRTVAFLEGGYDLAALRDSVATTVAALGGVDRDSRRSGASDRTPGVEAVDAAEALWSGRRSLRPE